MPIRTDLSPAFRPTTPSSTTAPSAEAPALTADQLINKAVNGSLTPGEASQLKQMLDSPAMKSAFTDQQREDLQKFAEGKGLPPREASELHSDLKLVKNASELPGRFGADLVLAHDALLEHAALLRAFHGVLAAHSAQRPRVMSQAVEKPKTAPSPRPNTKRPRTRHSHGRGDVRCDALCAGFIQASPRPASSIMSSSWRRWLRTGGRLRRRSVRAAKARRSSLLTPKAASRVNSFRSVVGQKTRNVRSAFCERSTRRES